MITPPTGDRYQIKGWIVGGQRNKIAEPQQKLKPPKYYYVYPPPLPYGTGYGGPQMADGYGQGAGYPCHFQQQKQGYYTGTQGTNMGALPDHGGDAAIGAPVYGHGGQHDMVNKQLGQDHSHCGSQVTNKGLPASDTARAGAPASGGPGQPDVVNEQLGHDNNHGEEHAKNNGLPATGGATAGAAANVGHGQRDMVNNHACHDHGHGGGYITAGNNGHSNKGGYHGPGYPAGQQYGGYGHGSGYHGQNYGGCGYHGGPGYSSQFPQPHQGGYNYGMNHAYSGAQHMNFTGAPVYGHGHETVNKQPCCHPHNSNAAAGAAGYGYHHGQHYAYQTWSA